MTDLSSLIERIEKSGEKLPCDVFIAPHTLISKGCDWITLLEAIDARRGAEARGFPTTFKRPGLDALRAHLKARNPSHEG